MSRTQLTTVSFCVATIMLSSAAFFNRFPLRGIDTGTYLHSAHDFFVPVERSVFYGLFIRASMFLGKSLWWPVLAQAALVGGLLVMLIEKTCPGAKFRHIGGLLALLAVGTAEPWFCGQLMADAFSGALALSACLLIVHGSVLKRWQIAALTAALTLSILVHYSHLPIAVALVALASLRADLRKNILPAGSAILAAMLIIPTAHRALTGKAFYSRSGHVFIMNRLVQSRLVDRLLEEHCAERNYVLCSYKDALKPLGGPQFLWLPDSPLQRIGGWEHSAAVIWPVIIDATLYYSLQNLKSVLGFSARQMVTVATDEGVLANDNLEGLRDVLRQGYPQSVPAFQASRQERGELIGVVQPLSKLHVLIALLATLSAVVLLAWPGLTLAPGARSTLGFMLLFCVLNAVVCGMSEPASRYQARAAWLLALSVVLVGLSRYLGTANDEPSKDSLPGGGISGRVAVALAASVGIAIVGVFLCLRWISGHYRLTAPSVNVPKPVVVWPTTEIITQRLAVGTLKGNPALVPGVQLKLTTLSGKEFVATVKEVDGDFMMVDCPWEMMRW